MNLYDTVFTRSHSIRIAFGFMNANKNTLIYAPIGVIQRMRDTIDEHVSHIIA